MNNPLKPQFRDWIWSIPFLILFSVLMLTADILQRIAVIFGVKAQEKVYNFVNFTVLKLLQLAGVQFNFPDEPELPIGTPLIVISYHQSLMDIPILVKVFKAHRLRFISKRELAKNIPYVASSLRNMGHALIDRDNRTQATTAIKDLATRMKENAYGVSIFPEGTRARDGEIRTFKVGGFKTLIESLGQAIVVPVVIDGSWKISKFKLMPIPYGIKVNISVLDGRIVTPLQDPAKLIEEIHGEIKSTLLNNKTV